ncbi:MAG: DUF559 domain-containing protein [Myxococcales bacterium]|nr:DUF559 domain-containing protein [Myxococcales bacterium]
MRGSARRVALAHVAGLRARAVVPLAVRGLRAPAGTAVRFAVPWARLVIEVDGAHHVARGVADARRDRELERCEWRVLRLPAALVARDVAEAVQRVRAALGGE